MKLSLLILLFALCGCSTTGLFVSADHFYEERLLLREDGTFAYEYWTDDGSCIACSAEGTWRRVGANTIETLGERCSSTGSTSGSLPATERWRVWLGRLHRAGSKPFLHRPGPPEPSTICEPSANQSLERTRWASAVRFAVRQSCRTAQLRIR